jgi:hypothetical protein
MDDRRFDSLVRQLASGATRRRMLKGLLGLGVTAAVGNAVVEDADAARRGYSGPQLPSPPTGPCTPSCPAHYCGDDGCGNQCPCEAGWSCISSNGTCGRQCSSKADCPASSCGPSTFCYQGICYDPGHIAGSCVSSNEECPAGFVCSVACIAAC